MIYSAALSSQLWNKTDQKGLIELETRFSIISCGNNHKMQKHDRPNMNTIQTPNDNKNMDVLNKVDNEETCKQGE